MSCATSPRRADNHLNQPALGMATSGLTGNHERSLLASVQHAAQLIRQWTADWLQDEWAPPFDRAVAAYLDVLKRWATDGLAQLREDFESGSRPIIAQLPPDAAPASGNANAPPIESDLRWLHQPNDPKE